MFWLTAKYLMLKSPAWVLALLNFVILAGVRSGPEVPEEGQEPFDDQ